MLQIAKNKYYELFYDPLKNQISWKVFGNWTNVNIVPNLEIDWNKAISMSRPGFKLLADLTQMKDMHPQVRELHARIQGMMLNRGVREVAAITVNHSSKSIINSIGEKSGLKEIMGHFETVSQGQDWLDQ